MVFDKIIIRFKRLNLNLIIMKKFYLLLLLTASAASSIQAQGWKNDRISFGISRNYVVKYANWLHAYKDTSIAAKNIYSMREETYDYNSKSFTKKRSYITTSVFDTNGYEVKTIHENKTGKEKIIEAYTLDNKGRVLNYDVIKNNKLKYRVTNTYDDSGNRISYSFFIGEKLKLQTYNFYEYKNNKLQKLHVYGSNSAKEEYLHNYAYLNDTGQLLVEEVLDGKGKLVYRRDYDCNHYGTLTKKEAKKETRICRSQVKLPNGHTQTVYEQNMGTETYRYIYELDSLNRNVKMIHYRGKYGDKLYYTTATEFGADTTVTTSEHYNLKTGTLEYSYISILNHAGKYISTTSNTFNKGKLTNSWITSYTYQDNLLKSSRSYSTRRPKIESVTEFEYRPQASN